MVIQCPDCTTRFKLSDDKLKPEGIKVRCAKCRHIFNVMPETAPESTPAPAEPAAEKTVISSAFAAEPEEEKLQIDAEAQTSASDDLWGNGFEESELGTSPDEQKPAAAAEETSAENEDWGLSFEKVTDSADGEESSELPASESDWEIDEATEAVPAQGTTATDDDWSVSFDEDELDLSSEEEEPAAETAAPPAADDEWDASLEGMDLETPAVDDMPTETSHPDTEFQLDDDLELEAAAEPDLAATSADFGLSESPEEELTEDAFDFAEEISGSGSIDEFEFDEEPEASETSSVDEVSFEEETSAEAGQDLSEFSFEESASDEFSFESDSAETEEAFSFDKDDLFASDDEVPAEEQSSGGIAFDEPQEDETGGNNFDFNGIAFGENEEAIAPAVEPQESIAPVEKAPAVEMPESAPPPPVEPTVSLPTPPKQKRKSPMSSVLSIFLLLLLALGGVAGYLLWQGGTTEISQIISRFTEQQETNIPTAQIRLPLPNSFFITNKKVGQLFVVQGEAVNGFPANRSAIAVKGMLHDEKGNVLMQQTVFCGNTLDHEDLQNAPFDQIEEAMNNQFGNVLSNLNVKPGKAIPYMIVFRDLPNNVTEFTVEVADSKPGGQQ